MSEKKDGNKISVIKNGSLYVFGNLFNKAVAFITVPIFTRLLTTEEYGIVNTYTSWVYMLSVVVGLSVGNSIRNAYVDMHEELGNYISSIITLASINFGIIFTLTQLVLCRVNLSRALVTLCLFESFGNFIVNAIIVKFVMEEEAIKRTILLVLPNFFGTIVSVVLIGYLKSDKYYGRIVATCVCTLAFGLIVLVYYLFKYRTFVNKKYWQYALPISLPLVLHGLSCNILGTSDRTIITMYRGAAESGVYSLIYNLSMVAGVVTSSAESVWIPKFTIAMKDRDYNTVNKQIKIYIYLVLFAFAGLLTISPELVVILGGREYLSGLNMIVPIVSASFVMFIYGIYVNVEYFYKETKIIASSTIVAALLNLVLNLILVPLYGAMAAAITTFFSYCVSLLMHGRMARKIDSNVAPIRMLMFPVSIFLMTCVITYVWREHVWIRWGLMFLLGIVYLVKIKKEFKDGYLY